MEQLFEVFKALALVAGILFLLVVILAIIGAIINRLTYKKRQNKAWEQLKADVDDFISLLENLEQQKEKQKHKKEKTTEPKQKKTTKNKKNVKEDK